MTPKEKSEQIFNSMHAVYNMEQYPDFTIEFDDNKKNDELWERNRDLFGNIYKEFAKECALIAVDEILSFIEDDREDFSWKTYYEEVKQEIEAL